MHERLRIFLKGRIIVILALLALSLILNACGASRQSVQKESEQLEIPQGEKVGLSEVILGAGDEMQVSVYLHSDLTKKILIPPDGKIFYPLIGEIQVEGMSMTDLRHKIREGLAEYIIDPQVSLEVISLRSQKIFVLGEVQKPGIFLLEGRMDLVEAISRAGGFTLDASESSVMLIRGDLSHPEARKIDLKKALKKGDITKNVALQKGDIIYVPASYIADVDRFFRHFGNIIFPVVALEQGIILGPQVRDLVVGKKRGSTTTNIVVVPGQ